MAGDCSAHTAFLSSKVSRKSCLVRSASKTACVSLALAARAKTSLTINLAVGLLMIALAGFLVIMMYRAFAKPLHTLVDRFTV